jgi:predicted ATPase
VQGAAHGGLLRGARQQLHAQIAEALETLSPEMIETQPDLFAQHYAEAGLVEKSVSAWGKAGQRSTARSAMAEAAAQFQKGLDQLPMLPDSPERQRQELEIRSALGAVLQAVKGHAAPETGHAYARARELWEQLGSPSEFLHVPFAQSVYHVFRCEIDRAQLLAQDLLRLSRERNDTAGLVLGHLAVGRDLLFTGKFASARLHFEEGLAVYDPSSHWSLVHHVGVHPHVTSRALLGIVLLCLGFADQGLAQSNEAIVEADSLAHPPSLAASLGFGTRLLSLVRENSVLDGRVDRLVAVTTEQGFAVWRALGTIYRGWTKVKNGELAEGTSLLRSGSIAYRATGTESLVPYHMALLAAACEIAGRVEEGLTLLDDALQIVERTGERWVTAELHRRKGQLLQRQGHTEPAEELYRKAMSIAEEQEAKLWGLRAAASLAGLRRGQGRYAEARDLLAPIYGWFTEGFNTPDLKDAKALLDGLQ